MEKEACNRCVLLQEQIDELRQKNLELERRLLIYENAHTPPSKAGRNYPKREPTGNPVGAPKGHSGTTRPTPQPQKTINVTQDACAACQHPLGKPTKILKRIIEDLPEPRPITVTQYNVHAYLCANCAEVNIASHPDCPAEGRFGYNLQAQVALMKFEDRLPYRKIADALNRQYCLSMTPATILEILEKVACSCEPAYEQIRQQVKISSNVYADETGQKVQGKQWWTWVFTTLTNTLFLIRKSRGQQPVKEVLGDAYHGILNCDGLKVYPMMIKHLQRCWAHLLREAKLLAQEKNGQAALLYQELCEMFERVKAVRAALLSKEERRQEHEKLAGWMTRLIGRSKAYTELRSFARKIEHGLQHWFTCVLHPEVEPTNNRAERALREMVVQRKSIGTLRNERGTHMTEVLMSCIQTWKMQGLNPLSMLRQTLSISS